MRALVAWRILTHEVARSALAVFGVLAAVVMVFLQLGFYSSVPRGSMIIYDALDYDIALASRDYTFQISPGSFPRRRLLQALAVPEVASAVPLYEAFGRWLNAKGHLQREVFVIGVDPDRGAFRNPSIESKLPLLEREDTALVDDSTRKDFGSIKAGTTVEISHRTTHIVGDYTLGTGFVSNGAVIVSDQNFVRLFPENGFDKLQLGLIRLRPGSNVEKVAERLRKILPSDTRVFTRSEFAKHEQAYWLNSTSTGLVFGFGTVVAGLVGVVILFQTLSTLILRNLREYAVLKAMGYTNSYLAGVIVSQALLLTVTAFGPAIAASYGLYHVTREATFLPVYMTGARIVWVLVATLVTTLLGSLLTVRILERADPADLF